MSRMNAASLPVSSAHRTRKGIDGTCRNSGVQGTCAHLRLHLYHSDTQPIRTAAAAKIGGADQVAPGLR